MINLIFADSKILTFTIKDSAGEAVDLSAATVKFMVKKSLNDLDEDAIITKEIVHPATNILGYEITSAESILLVADSYYCALKIFYDNNAKQTVYSDTLKTSKGVFNE